MAQDRRLKSSVEQTPFQSARQLKMRSRAGLIPSCWTERLGFLISVSIKKKFLLTPYETSKFGRYIRSYLPRKLKNFIKKLSVVVVNAIAEKNDEFEKNAYYIN
jgi:hypothetical protein